MAVLSSSNSLTLGNILSLPDETIASARTIVVEIGAPLSIDNANTLTASLQELASRASLSNLCFEISIRCGRDASRVLTDGLVCLQGLKEVALRLNAFPDRVMVALVRSTALALTKRIPKVPFPFTRFPAEIRQKILTYTNLVPDTSWHIPAVRPGIRIRNGLIARSIGICCSNCTTSLSSATSCTCFLSAAAYSTMCSCYEHPTELFLANKMLYDDSTYVFYSKNRFCLSAKSSAANLAFLQKLSDRAIHAIRMIDIQFSKEQVLKVAHNNAEELRDFKAMIALIAAKCNLPALHFVFDHGCNNMDRGEDRELGDNLQWLRAVYPWLASAMKPLKGVRRFDVFLTYWHAEEERMEKEVMGDSYDALAKGKIHWSRRDPTRPHMFHDFNG